MSDPKCTSCSRGIPEVSLRIYKGDYICQDCEKGVPLEVDSRDDLFIEIKD